MRRSNRLLVLLAGAIALAGAGYFAVPVIWMSYMIFFGPGLACGNNCAQPEYTAPESAIVMGAIALYILLIALGVWWVMKGEAD